MICLKQTKVKRYWLQEKMILRANWRFWYEHGCCLETRDLFASVNHMLLPSRRIDFLQGKAAILSVCPRLDSFASNIPPMWTWELRRWKFQSQQANDNCCEAPGCEFLTFQSAILHQWHSNLVAQHWWMSKFIVQCATYSVRNGYWYVATSSNQEAVTHYVSINSCRHPWSTAGTSPAKPIDHTKYM